MTAYIFSEFFSTVTTLGLGAFVLVSNLQRPLNRAFAALCASIGVWSFGLLMRDLSAASGPALFWVRFCYLGAIAIPPLFLLFVRELTGLRPALLKVSAALAAFFAAADATPFFIAGVAPRLSFTYYGTPGPLLPAFAAAFLFVGAYGHLILIREFRRSTGLKRTQLRYVIAAFFIGFAGGSSTLLPVFSVDVFPFGYYFISLYTIIIAYAIVRHRLIDAHLVVTKTVTYSLLLAALLLPSSLLLLYEQRLLYGEVNPLFALTALSLLVLTAFVFPRLKVRTERTVEQVLFKGRYDYRRLLHQFSRDMVTILDLDDLLRTIVGTVSRAMGLKTAAVFLYDRDARLYRVKATYGRAPFPGPEPEPAPEEALVRHLVATKEIVVREEIEGTMPAPGAEALVAGMRQAGAQVCIPLIAKDDLIGMICLPDRSSGEMYTGEDIELLTTIANQAATAVENSRLYEDLKRSRQYIRRSDRLAALGTLAAGLAHEIRNPLVSIKTFTQLLPERYDDEEFRTHFLKITADEVDRICDLIDELLHFARPTELDLQPTAVNDLVDSMLLLVEGKCLEKSLGVTRGLDPALPEVLLDAEQVKQVLLNVILNAIHAVGEGGALRVATRPIPSRGQGPLVQIEIADNGTGIEEADIEHIFDPFFTTKDRGSGLGLAISHQIIKEHHGTITASSRPGEGTSFCIELPLDPRRHERRRDEA